MKEKSNLPKTLLEHIPWEERSNPIWPASSFILHRNINKHLFPGKMDETALKQSASLLQRVLLESSLLENPVFLPAEQVDPLDKEFLFEHFLSLEGFQNTLAGQGFVVDNTSRFLAMLNIQDHLQIQLIDCQGAWEKTWSVLNQIEKSLSKSIVFAYNAKFGYLTSDPSLSGTALTILTYLHLPALIHYNQLQDALLKNLQEEVTASSIEGSLDGVLGDIVVLRNAFTLGVNEEGILHSLHATACKLMALEKTLRIHLPGSYGDELKDGVSRSFGLLLHSYQLQTKEAMNALSMLKMGLD
ncbi:MAG: protein arginine kinase, partial [Chlamydiales bacterium]|nr:protein arginine kinase [Chlamydiales bacterium]